MKVKIDYFSNQKGDLQLCLVIEPENDFEESFIERHEWESFMMKRPIVKTKESTQPTPKG